MSTELSPCPFAQPRHRDGTSGIQRHHLRGSFASWRPWLGLGIAPYIRRQYAHWKGEITLTPTSSMVLFTITRGDRILIEGGIVHRVDDGFSSHT